MICSRCSSPDLHSSVPLRSRRDTQRCTCEPASPSAARRHLTMTANSCRSRLAAVQPPILVLRLTLQRLVDPGTAPSVAEGAALLPSGRPCSHRSRRDQHGGCGVSWSRLRISWLVRPAAMDGYFNGSAEKENDEAEPGSHRREHPIAEPAGHSQRRCQPNRRSGR